MIIDEREVVPFSSNQKELWLSHKISDSGQEATKLKVFFPVKSKISPDLFRQALAIALKHVPLVHSELSLDAKEPYCQAADPDDIDFSFFDASESSVPSDTAEGFLDGFFAKSVGRHAVHFALIRLGGDESLYALNASHLIMDGLTAFFHVDFVAEIYSALKHGKELPVREKAGFSDVYLKDRKYFSSTKVSKDVLFWKEHLDRIPGKRIFRAKPGRPDLLCRSRFKKYFLSPEASACVERLLKKHGVSPAVCFTALHALVVAFMCDEKEIVIQTPVAFGERKAFWKRQGSQVATPPLFLDLSTFNSVEALLEEIASQSKLFFRHIRTPYQMAMRELKHRDFSTLGDTFINFLPNSPTGNDDFSVETVVQQHNPEEPAMLGALVLQEPVLGGFSFTMQSSRNHFSEQDVDRYIKRVEQLSLQLEKCPDLSLLNYLLDEEGRELAVWQSGESRQYAVEALPALFDRTAQDFANRDAVRDEHGQILTYAQLRENSLACAAWLEEQGVGKGDVVAVLARRRLRLPEMILGIMRRGAVYLPLDPKSPESRIRHIVDDAKAGMTLDVDAPGYVVASVGKRAASVGLRDGAYLIYTSGSTGKPKGVLVPHEGFVNMIQGQIEVFGVGPEDRVLQFASPAFDASLSEIFMALLSGACLCPVTDTYRNAPWALRDYMSDNAISVVTLPPSYLHLFNQEPFPGLRVLITAGEPPVANDAMGYAERLQYFNAYGPTETCVCASIKHVMPGEQSPISVGCPIPNGRAYIVDSARRCLPTGMVGELCVGGASLALGYYGNEDMTRQRFVRLPSAQNDMVYATGDLALWSDDGEILLVGRSDDQVKVRGNRVELGEASFLLETCPDVSQAFVLTVEDVGGQLMLAACVVLQPGATLRAAMDWAKDNLPAYMIPGAWHELDAMPSTVTGKIDRDALKQIVRRKKETRTEQPVMDSGLLSLCRDVLGGECDPDADFFSQGGDSLKAMALLYEVRNQYGVDIPFRDFVKCDSLRGLMPLLQEMGSELPEVPYATVPLNQNQYELWAYQQANEDSVDYNMPLLLEAGGERAGAFVRALYQAICDQPLLSCTVGGEIDAPCFVPSKHIAIPMETKEFPDAGAANQHFSNVVHRPFDLRNEPPVRMEVVEFSGRTQVLVLVHHIAGDAKTLEILLKNAVQYLNDTQATKGSLDVQVAFCRREQSYLRSDDYVDDKSYWEHLLEPPVGLLCTACSGDGAMADVDIEPALAAGLQNIAERSGSSLLACFISLVGTFLQDRFERSEILIGVPVGLRETREEFETAGFFVNTVPLRLRADEKPDPVANARNAAAQLKTAITHSRYSNRAVVPDILVTHATVSNIREHGLQVDMLKPELEASKLAASFTLETGVRNRIVLEYDRGFISDGRIFLDRLQIALSEWCGLGDMADPQRVLSDAWFSILHVPPSPESDFFRDGGDSIKAIQITGVLHRNGIKALSAASFLQTPDFRALAKQLEKTTTDQTSGPAYAPVEPGQYVPLLPLQERLISRNPEHWHHFYMMLPLQIGLEISIASIEDWVHSLPERYEAFRLAFQDGQAVMLGASPEPVFRRRSFESGIDNREVFRAALQDAVAELDPKKGRTFGATLAEQGQKRFLILAGHHLVLDAFSLDILRRDLIAFCRNVESEKEAQGMAIRAREMQKLVQDGIFPTQEDHALWTSVCKTSVGGLNALQQGTADKAGQRTFESLRLVGFRPEYTQSVLSELLSALSAALYAQGQRETVFVTMESHGRDSLLPGFDTGRSVGWFTGICPMPLTPSESGQSRHAVGAWLRDMFTARNCHAYGYLRLQHPETFGFDSQISFNYLGRLSSETEHWITALPSAAMPGDMPDLIDSEFELDTPLELIAFQDEDGVLQLGAYFNPYILETVWVSGLLEEWKLALKQSPVYREPLSDDVVDRVLELAHCTADEAGGILLPEVVHEPMLYQYLSEDEAVYTQQVAFRFRGQVNDFLLLRAWKDVLARHESLRTLFPMPYDGEFYRLVLHTPRENSEYFDLSSLPEPLAASRMEEMLKSERERGFDLNTGPLIRAQLLRFAHDEFVLSWCFHHLLMDGWCMGILLDELFTRHRILESGSTEKMPESMPLSEYARWRAEFDTNAAADYWNSLLEGFASVSSVAKREPDGTVVDPVAMEFSLDTERSLRLRNRADERSVTLPVLIQAAWGIVLGDENSTRDVVYGMVTSGRPAELDGMDKAVGLFIQTVPLRVQWTEDSSFGDLLATIKEQSFRQMEYGYLPLSEIGRNLFDHLMVFENYPFDMEFYGGKLELLDIRGFEKIPYPLGISVIPGDQIQFRFLYDPAVMEHDDVRGLQDRLLHVLEIISGDADVSCRELESGLGSVADNRMAFGNTREALPGNGERALTSDSSLPVDGYFSQKIQDIYESVFRQKVVSRDADFFELGGHSLLAMRVLAQLDRQLSVRIGMDDFLANSSINALTGLVGKSQIEKTVIPRIPVRERYPLSASQMRIWFLQRMHGDGYVYQIPFAARLRSAVDPEVLQKALLLLEERHDALRLRVAADQPEQLLAPPGHLKLEFYDRPYRQESLEQGAMELGLDKPLVRVCLFRESSNESVLLFRFHHIIFDGWSAEICLRELNEAYAAVSNDAVPDWQPLDTDFVSYVGWESKREFKALDAFRERFLPLPESLALPLDFPRPSVQSLAGSVFVSEFDRERSLGIKTMASSMGVTPFSVLLALVNVFLYRHTGQSDLIVGSPVANRELAEVQGLIGLFVNTVPIRASLHPDKGFRRLVKDVSVSLQESLAVQDCPLEKLIDALKVDRNPSRNPLFDVLVAHEDAAWNEYGRGPLKMEPMELPHRNSKFDLSFYFKEIGEETYSVHMEYCTDLFRAETIKAMSQRLAVLLDDILAAPEKPLSVLNILPSQEHAVLQTFNNTAEHFDTGSDTDARFRKQMDASGQAAAIVESSGQFHSYGDFDAEVDKLAAYLADNGVRPRDYVGVCFERSLDMMVAVFAVMRAGAVYVPLSPTLPSARFASICEDLERCTILCQSGFEDRFNGLEQPVLCPKRMELPTRDFVPPVVKPEDVAYVIFTSGSTGRPKGVAIEHRSLANRLLWMQARFPIEEGDVILQKTTTSFDVSIWELFWWSWTGAGLALLEPGGEKFPDRIVEAVQTHGVTVIHFVPSMLRVFIEHLESHPPETQKLHSLKYVFTSGEALSADLVKRFQSMVGAELHNLYGPTEATVDVSWFPCRELTGDRVPIGKPVSNTRLHVLDGQGQMVPVGVSGEICISGIQVARGYVNREELTARSFLPDPFVHGERMYRTGDLGRWLHDGNIEYQGRNDDQVKIRGFRIELGEVEAALVRCAGVSQAVVRVCRIGDYDALEAFLLPLENAELSVRSLRDGLSGKLPEYMWPAVFRQVAEIPLSPSGKVDRKQLRGNKLGLDGGTVGATLTPVQEAVRDIWLEVMPEIDAPGIDQGFFEIGGNSLLLVRLHALLDNQWKGVFSLAGLFSESTIRAQAEAIERLEQTGTVTHEDLPQIAHDAPIAIIGMGVRLGDYEVVESFWNDLEHGADKNVPLPQKRREEVRQIFEAVGFDFDPSRLREAAYLSDISSFDHKRFGLSPLDASLIEPQQRVFLEVTLHALDDAGYGGEALQDERVGVFVGASPYRLFQDAVTRAFPEQAEQIYLLNVPSNTSARLSYLKNWDGPAATIDTACSSVLKALHDACRSLRTGESRLAVVGGVHTIALPVKGGKTFTIESGSGRTRTFDAKADGVGAGEGGAVFLLKLLEQAERDNDAVHAVIIGSAVNQDGRSSSMAAPNPEAQAAVIDDAARNASVSLDEVDFFEAHGTGTVLGDPVEVEGLGRAFAKQEIAPAGKALIGSVKGNVGHLDAAAGAVGLAKAVVSLEKGIVPPQPHFEHPNPHIDFDAAPVRVARVAEALSPSAKPWICGVSAFGLSGINAHVLLREGMPSVMPPDDGRWYCIPLSAGDEDGLSAYCRQLRDIVARNGDWPVRAVAGTLIAGREHLPVRAVVVARSCTELLDGLDDLQPVTVRKMSDAKCVAGAFEGRDDALAAAESYLQGHTPVWPEGSPLYRVHLPVTPFRRTSSWPAFHSSFLSAPMDTPDGKLFSIAIDRDDFWPVAEHLLNNVPTLVGMGMIDLIGEAMQTSSFSIGKLRWLSPVTHAEGQRASLRLVPEGEGFAAQVHHFRDGQWNLAAGATVRANFGSSPAARDVAAIQSRLLPQEVQAGDSVVHISRRWDCRKGLWSSDDGRELLSLLSLPDEFRSDLNTFKYHPAMLDLAVSLALHGGHGFMPAQCGAVRTFHPLAATVYAHVKVRDKNSHAITADCVVMDVSGRVLVEMADMVFLSLHRTEIAPQLHGISWKHVELPARKPDFAQAMMLLGSDDAPLLETFSRAGIVPRTFPIEDGERKMLAREIQENGISHLVCLPLPEDASWTFAAFMREVCRVRPKHALRITVVGHGCLTGHDSSPEYALALGTLLSLRHEEPLISVSYAEIEEVNQTSLETLQCALGRIDGPFVVHGIGEVSIPELAPLSIVSDEKKKMRDCVVITGGLGGMGLTLARQITDRTDAEVVLLHRNAGKENEIPYACYRCDVNDEKQLRETLQRIRDERGPIRGIIHAAGVAGEGFLLSKSREAYENVLAPKVTGTWNLHRATLEDDLDFFVLSSSRSALVGAPGQTDYTAANAFLNGFAHYRQAQGLPALAMCWNAWAEVGMAARMNSEDGGFSLPPEHAFGVLEQALNSGRTQAVVSMPGEDVSRYPLASLLVEDVEVDVTVEPVAETGGEEEILAVFRECLGYEELSRDDDFFDLGGDSISATRIVSRIGEIFGIEASVMDILESDTLGDYVDEILDALKAKKPAKEEKGDRKEEAHNKEAIEQAPERDRYPVGREQLSILYADLLSDEHTGYNLPAFLRLPDDLDVARLELAVAALIQRHEVLRTTFCDFDQPHPNMVIHPFESFSLEEVHLADLAQKDSLITPFDPRKGALFRIKLLNVDNEGFFLFYDLYHALGDGRTIALLNAELYRLYHQQPLEPVGRQQKDFAWHQYVHSNEGDREYWKELFKGELPKLDLPSSYRRPDVHTNRGATHEFELPSELVAGLKALGRRIGVTNYNLVLAAWGMLVHQCTGDEDFVIAVMVDSRGEYFNTAGMLASLLPVRLNVAGSQPVENILKEIQQRSNDALRHRSYILNNLLTDLHPPMSLDRTLLSEVVLSYMNFEFGTEKQELFEPLRFLNPASKADLSIFCSDTGDRISFALEYYADLFSHDDVTRFAGDFINILELLVSGNSDDPLPFEYAPKRLEHVTTQALSGPSSVLPVFVESEGGAEKEQQSLEALFSEVVAQFPDRKALSDGVLSMSFAELDRLSSRMAAFIRKLDLGREPVVGVLCERSALVPAAAMGILRAGAVYLPVERELPLVRQEAMLEPAQLILTDSACLRDAEYYQYRIPGVSHVLCLDSPRFEDVIDNGGELQSIAFWEHVTAEGSDQAWKSYFDGRSVSPEVLEALAADVLNKSGFGKSMGKRVLDIGSGSGVMAQRLLEVSHWYTAVDLSRTELDRLESPAKGRAAKFHQMEAVDIGFLEEGEFDLINLTGVAENFPGYNYLRKVLDLSVAKLSPDGALVVGAVWDLEKRGAFREALKSYALESGDNSGLVRFDAGAELFLPPGFFMDWAAHSPTPVEVSISHTCVEHAELANYRFDVTVTRAGENVAKVAKIRFGSDDLPEFEDGQAVVCNPEQAAYIVFTSGSTGVPKGVVVEHRNLLHILSALNGFSAGCEQVALVAPLSFDASVQQLAVSVFAGKPLHILADEERKNPERFHEAVVSNGIELCDMTPAFFNVLVEYLADRSLALPLRKILIAGEVLRPDMVSMFYSIAGNENVVVYNIYGPTECTVDSSAYRIDFENHKDFSAYPIGVPLKGAHITIRDKGGEPVADGETGEIWISGAGVSRGYMNAGNTDAFVQHKGERCYRTGDRGFIQDGLVFYLGRKDQQVKIRGNRVEIGEVEGAIAGFPGVRQVAVVADSFDGRGEKDLAAYVVGDVDAARLKLYLEQHLPSYCVPGHVVPMVELPMSTNRKVDRKALPSPLGQSVESGKVPAGALEEKLAGIWQRLLGVEVRDVDQSFFAMGGHSILAVRLIAMLDKELGLQMSLSDLFAYPTVARQAELFKGRQETDNSPVINLARCAGGAHIFLFHPVGGGVFCYSALADLLSPRFNVHAVEAAGFSPERTALNTELFRVEDLAAYYLDEIFKVQSENIIFGGWSFGGILAYETACLYEKTGRTSGPVLVLDSVADNTQAKEVAGKDEVGILKSLLQDALFFDEDKLRALPREEKLKYLVRCGEKTGLLPQGFSLVQMENLLHTYRNNAIAAARYESPTVSDKDVLLVRALELSEATRHYVDDDSLGWRQFIPKGNITLKWTEGSHETMLSPGLVDNVAKHIMGYLDHE